MSPILPTLVFKSKHVVYFAFVYQSTPYLRNEKANVRVTNFLASCLSTDLAYVQRKFIKIYKIGRYFDQHLYFLHKYLVLFYLFCILVLFELFLSLKYKNN